MRRVHRPPLSADTQKYLDKKQLEVDATNVEIVWKGARRSKPINTVLTTLQGMMGSTGRCMYCVDSHGCDIEHFWPKTPFPDRAFHWPNLLLCCTECGRFKGSKFPLDSQNQPLLVNPADEDPWQHLDFDPQTGNLTARYDLKAKSFSAKGQETVTTLWLDRRESMAQANLRTYQRLVACIKAAMKQPPINVKKLVKDLHSQDDHGLLGWCFTGTGARLVPFATLKKNHPAAWAACVAAVQ